MVTTPDYTSLGAELGGMLVVMGSSHVVACIPWHRRIASVAGD
jgi:hypothetical protein